jgi:hypothetical protein
MRYEVKLRLHKDENGFWGLCHDNTVGQFNAFWDASGVFHDVFEHFFEGKYKYFQGDLTLWGEMAASGAAIAYKSIGIDNFKYRGGFNRRDFTADTKSILQDTVYGLKQEPYSPPYVEYPVDNYLCKVPYQKHPDDCYWASVYELDTWLSEYDSYINELREKDRPPQVRKFGRSISKTNIRNCYIWGWKQGMKILGEDHKHSYTFLNDFLEYWNTLTKQDPQSLFIDDESAGSIKYFKFVVNSYPKLKVKTTLIDDFGNEYNLKKLIET